MLENLFILSPEIYLAGLAMVALLVGVFSKPEKAFKNTFTITLTGLFGVLLILAMSVPQYGLTEQAFPLIKTNSTEYLFINYQIIVLTKILLVVCGIILLGLSKSYLEYRQLLKFEYNVLFPLAILGAFVALSSLNLMIVFIGLELMSFSTYILVGFNTHSTRAVISANKYFVLGAVSSALMLYGISLLYLTTGSVSYAVVAQKIQTGGWNALIFAEYFALALIAFGLFFKIAIAPLQFYLRDVLYAANRPMLGFISTITKVTGLVVLYQIIMVIMPVDIPDLHYKLMLSFATITIFIGAVAALKENNINRLLAYSSIHNAGFMLIGVTVLNFNVTAVYVVNYCLVILAVVSFILSYKVRGQYIKKIQDLAFIAKKDYKFALTGVILMFSLAGLPPFLMFYAKFLIIKLLLDVHFIGWAILVVVFSVIGAAYCLRIIKYLYFVKTESQAAVQSITSAKMITYLLMVAILLLSIFPDWISLVL